MIKLILVHDKDAGRRWINPAHIADIHDHRGHRNANIGVYMNGSATSVSVYPSDPGWAPLCALLTANEPAPEPEPW